MEKFNFFHEKRTFYERPVGNELARFNRIDRAKIVAELNRIHYNQYLNKRN